MKFLLLATLMASSAFAVSIGNIKSFNCYQYADKQIRVPSNHFFNEALRPEVSFSRSQKICSDLDYGLRDESPFTPFMNEVDAFKLIAHNEVGAYDSNNNGRADLDDEFEQTLMRDFGLNAGNYRSIQTFSHDNKTIGFMITPMFGQVGTCPRAGDFSPVASTIRKVYGTNTEPLYKAVRKPVYVLAQGRTVALPEDVIYVSESQINGAAFYLNQGRAFLHDRFSIERGNGFGVSFFWPADKTAPFIKKANQQEYEIKADAAFKRMVGCIPVQ